MYEKPSDYTGVIYPVQDKTLSYFYFMDRNHPLSDSKGRVWLHRHLISVKLGRWISKDEVVHHIDHNRTNNSLDNLEVMLSSEHTRRHAKYNEKLAIRNCKVCSSEFKPNKATSITCSPGCKNIASLKFTVSPEQLSEYIKIYSWEKIGKIFNVSGNAVIKRAKKFGLYQRKYKVYSRK